MIFKSYLTFGQISDHGKQSVIGTPSNLGLILEHITNLDEVRILSMYRYLADIWFLPGISAKIASRPNHNILNIAIIDIET